MAEFSITDKRFSFGAEQKQEFDNAFKQAAQDSDPAQDSTTPIDPKAYHKGKLYSDHLSTLGWHLEGLWTEAKGYRIYIEQRWLNDLRQYRGEYEPYVKGRIHPKRSKAFIRLTRTKVKTVNSRMGDILFPQGKEKNYGIEPTPVPDLPEEIMEQLIVMITDQVGSDVEVTPDMVEEIVRQDAKTRSDAMEKEIDDQLAEIKYRDEIRKVLHSGNLYGTGILKGPLVKRKVNKRWAKGEDKKWAVQKDETIIPFCKHVRLWDIYPDMSATEFDNAGYVFERYTMSRNKVVELANRPDFDGDAIRAYLEENKDGDAQYENFENQLRSINPDDKAHAGSGGSEGSAPLGTGIARLYKKYNLKEFWGYLSVDQLRERGVELPEGMDNLQEVAANVWMLGPLVIKAIMSPIEGVDIPYHFYYFDKDETSIFGEGIPSIMRDPQELSNAAVRALLDNAAISAGPIIEANIDLLADGEDPLDIYPFRVFQRTGTGAEAGQPAIHVNNQKAYTGEFLQMLQTFLQMGDEVTTIPRYMWGESGDVKGAGRTATGLSMLMGSVNITLKDQIKNFDDGVTKPYIRAHYFWNMEFSPKENIKGDFGVIAKGTGSLIAKEVKLETLVKYLQVISSFPELVQSIDVKKLNDALTDVLELDPITKSDAQLKAESEVNRANQQKQEQHVQNTEMIKAVSGGHIDSEVLQSILGGNR